MNGANSYAICSTNPCFTTIKLLLCTVRRGVGTFFMVRRSAVCIVAISLDGLHYASNGKVLLYSRTIPNSKYSNNVNLAFRCTRSHLFYRGGPQRNFVRAIVCFLFIVCVLLLLYIVIWDEGKTIGYRRRHRSTDPNPEEELPPSDSKLHIFRKAAVCSDSVICSDIGR